MNDDKVWQTRFQTALTRGSGRILRLAPLPPALCYQAPAPSPSGRESPEQHAGVGPRGTISSLTVGDMVRRTDETKTNKKKRKGKSVPINKSPNYSTRTLDAKLGCHPLNPLDRKHVPLSARCLQNLKDKKRNQTKKQKLKPEQQSSRNKPLSL